MFQRHRRSIIAHILLGGSLAAAGLGPAWGAAAAATMPGPDIIEPLSLHYGVNEIPAFLPDGRPATIVMAHRENGNAHAYNVYVIYALAAKGHGAYPGVPEIIDLQPQAGAPSDVIRDEPFDGEAEIGALRFVRERVEGHPSIALVRARRLFGTGMPLTDPAPVELTVWRVDGPSDFAGRTSYVFREAGKTVTERRYCNATSALHTEFGIAYPDGWDGTPGIDGCASQAEAARNAGGRRMLQALDVTSFDNATGPRRRPGLRTLADYGFTRIESFDDGWAYASQVDGSWTIGVLVLDDGPDRKLLCVTESANRQGTYRSTAVVEAVPAGNGSWRATGRVVSRSDCAAR